MNKYSITKYTIDGYEFKFRDIATSQSSKIIINELLNNEYGLTNININKNETFIDVGANIGIVSIYVKKKFGCKVIIFEPNLKNLDNLKYNIILNGFKLSDFEIHEKAVTDKDNDFVYMQENIFEMGGCNVLSSDINLPKIETVSLRNFIKNDVAYIKIDCEGSEYKIIPSIKDCLGEVKYIGIEFHRLNNIKETPEHLYNQIRESFKGQIFMSFWDDDGYNATLKLKNKLNNMDLKYKNNFYIDSKPTSEHGIIKTNQYEINEKFNKRLFVVDNFYKDPDAIRELALKQVYFDGEGAVGARTRKQFLFEGVKEKFEEIMGHKIPDNTEKNHGWYDYGINGRFQTCKAGTPLVYHCDQQRWAAMVYLTPDAPPQSGTSFFRHKETKIRHNSEIDWSSGQGLKVFNQKTFLDGTPYEMVDSVGNVYNRLVIFDGGLIHCASEYFGWDIPSSRLFHMYFFD